VPGGALGCTGALSIDGFGGSAIIYAVPGGGRAGGRRAGDRGGLRPIGEHTDFLLQYKFSTIVLILLYQVQ
jgi:hypothetical protein